MQAPLEGEIFGRARILIVDDQAANVRLLEKQLQRAGFEHLQTTTDSREAAALCRSFAPDLILLDLMMPYVSGHEVMQQIHEMTAPGDYLPILVLTADIDATAKQRALSEGARDFLTKPFDATEVMLRIKNLLETRFLHLQLQDQNAILETRVQERTRELEESQYEVLHRLARAAEYRDDDTGQHTQRVGRTSALLAQIMGLDDAQIDLLRRAAPLHDVGKIGISDSILLKPGKLLPEEFDVIKTHASIGAQLLAGGHSDVVKAAEIIALTHHEKWSGGGYPRNLQGEDIPLYGRIVALCDVFDALTYERPYKKAWPLEQAVEEIRNQSGKQFDPRIIEAFEQALQDGTWLVQDAQEREDQSHHRHAVAV